MVLPLESFPHAVITKRIVKTDMLPLLCSPPSDTALLLEMFRGEIVASAAASAAADIHCIAWENAANVRGKFG